MAGSDSDKGSSDGEGRGELDVDGTEELMDTGEETL